MGRPAPKGDKANPASPQDGCAGIYPDPGKIQRPDNRPERLTP